MSTVREPSADSTPNGNYASEPIGGKVDAHAGLLWYGQDFFNVGNK